MLLNGAAGKEPNGEFGRHGRPVVTFLRLAVVSGLPDAEWEHVFVLSTL